MNKDKGRGGIVVSIASVAGLDGFYSMPAYSATKHGVVGLNRCLGVRNFVELCYYRRYDDKGEIFCRLSTSITNMELNL